MGESKGESRLRERERPGPEPERALAARRGPDRRALLWDSIIVIMSSTVL